MPREATPEPAGDAQLIEAVRREREQASVRGRELEAARHRLLYGEREGGHYVYCACGAWTLEAVLCDSPATALGAGGVRHAEHVLKTTETTWVFGAPSYAGSRFGTPFVTMKGEEVTGTGWMHGAATGRKRCQFCKREWSVARCDFPAGGKCRRCQGGGTVYALSGGVAPLERAGYHDFLVNCLECAGTGRRMCNAAMCHNCRAHAEPDEDYCRVHFARAGLPPPPPPPPVLEDCVWIEETTFEGGKCLHASCRTAVGVGARALWFPERRRVMCAPCGASYLARAR